MDRGVISSNEPITIAFYNQKGGSGKTTAAFQTIGLLANEHKKKVLAIDVDPQGNLTKYLSSYSIDDSFPLLEDVVNQNLDVKEAIVKVLFQTRENAKPKYFGVDLIGAGKRFTEFLDSDNYYFFKDLIKDIINDYDFVIFDCPTQSEVSTLMAQTLIATEYVVIPCSLDTDSTDGYGALLDTVTNIKAGGYNNNLSVIGMFYSAVGCSGFEKWLAQASEIEFGKHFLGTIRRSKDVSESKHYSRPLTFYRRNGNVTNDYRKLLNTILDRINKI